MLKTNFQCLQALENGVRNECLIARPRSARSAALLVKQMRPSLRKRVKEAQRLSM
jgi:hypothetical protein